MSFAAMTRASADRLQMAAMGAVAGLACWILVDVLPDAFNDDRVVLFLAAFGGAFFAALLAASGPLSAARAAAVGLAVSLLPALLLLWASFRFETVQDYLETGHPLVAFAILVALPVPFLIAALGPIRDWRDYPELFDQSWNVVVRYVAAWLFTGLFWLVVVLSNELFNVIGLKILEDLWEIEPVPFVVTGLVLGLALAVVNELSDYVSPYLALRLLRLLLPVVLVVVVVFIVMVPVRGLSGLFGSLSAAGILMAMATGAITLVSTAIDQSDEEAVSMPFMRLASQALALTLPVLAGLAVYAIWMRVGQYGWSPDRLAAACVAGVVLLYALLYALAVGRRVRWMASIRAANTYLALLVIAVAAVWLTPLMNAQRISAADQLERFADGRTSLDDLDLWTIGKTWGKAGTAVVPRFADVARDGQSIIGEQLAALDKASDRYVYEQLLSGPGSDRMREFLSLVQVRPLGTAVPDGMFGQAGAPADWISSCGLRTAAGNPGCVILFADLLPEAEGDEAFLVTKQPADWVRAEMWRRSVDGQWINQGLPVRIAGPEAPINSDAVIDQIIEGQFELETYSIPTIRFGETHFMMLP